MTLHRVSPLRLQNSGFEVTTTALTEFIRAGGVAYSAITSDPAFEPESHLRSHNRTDLPLPNAPGTSGGLVNNFVTNASVGGNSNETVVHIDQNVSEKQHISARYTYWGNMNLPINPLGNGVCEDRCTEIFNTNNFVFNDTYSFSPTTVLDLNLSFQRFSYDRTPLTLGYNLTQLRWPASLNTEATFDALPVPCISGYDPAGIFCSQGAGSVIVAMITTGSLRR